ncbi:MAG: pyridoxamine 5'-phosphate oxidase family protein [Clostridia bacterium]
MRRADREIQDKSEIEKILHEADTIRIAMVDEGKAYLVAMNYVYMNGVIYLHSAKQGRKITILEANPLVAFQADVGAEIYCSDDVGKCSTRYESVYGEGRAIFVGEVAEKKEALDALMVKHAGKKPDAYPEQLFERTCIIKIEVEALTGKKSK